jgi:hypothetical protein
MKIMKRILVITFLFLLSIISYAQAIDDITQIGFSTSTRGYSKQVTIDASHLEVKEEGSRTGKDVNQSRKLTKKEWTQLCKQLKTVSLDEIADLKSPTMKRASDAAMLSTITITRKNGKTVSHDFDNENPHEKLQGLMNEIIKTVGNDKGR